MLGTNTIMIKHYNSFPLHFAWQTVAAISMVSVVVNFLYINYKQKTFVRMDIIEISTLSSAIHMSLILAKSLSSGV